MKEIVIKIDDEVYKYLEKRIKFGMATEMDEIVWNGKELPKGHGELKDVSKFVYDCDYDNGYGCDKICYCDGCTHHIIKESSIKEAETLVEADKGDTE